MQESLDRGLLFMAHNNNNFVGAGHQYASVWDNGDNLVDQLKTEIEVRRIGLANFSPALIHEGSPTPSSSMCCCHCICIIVSS